MPGARTRIRTRRVGGGGGPVAGNVDWTPEGLPLERGRSGPTLAELELSPELSRGRDVSLSTLDLAPELQRARAYELAALELAPETQRARNVSLSTLELSPEIQRGRNVDLSTLALAPEVQRGRNVGLDALALAPATQRGRGLSSLGVFVDETVSTKDGIVNVPPGCVGAAASDFTAGVLRVDGTAFWDAYCGWDMVRYGTGWTVVNAKFRFTPQLIPATSVGWDIDGIANNDTTTGEGWTESSGVTCANRPTSTGTLQTFTFLNTWVAGVRQTLTLNAAVLSYLEARLGLRSATFLFRPDTGSLLDSRIRSRDAVDPSFRPTLDITLQKTL